MIAYESRWFQAVRIGDVDTMRKILDSGFDVNTLSEDRETALHVSCQKNDLKTISFLLKNKASIESRDSIGSTPLMKTCEKGFKDAASLLLENGAKINAVDNSGDNAFNYICMGTGDVETAKILMKFKSNINVSNRYGMNSLMHSSWRKNFELTEFLLKKGLNPNQKDGTDKTPITYASDMIGNLQTVQLLIRNNADVQAEDNYGWSVWTYACKRGDPEICEYLVEYFNESGLSDFLKKKDIFGSNAFAHACEKGNYEVAELIMKKTNIDVENLNHEGYSGIYWYFKYMEKNSFYRSEEYNENLIELFMEKIGVNNIKKYMEKDEFLRRFLSQNPNPKYDSIWKKCEAKCLDRERVRKNLNYINCNMERDWNTPDAFAR